MTGAVLVLNRSWHPLRVTTLRRALTMLYVGAAHALDDEYRPFDFSRWIELPVAPGVDVIRTTNRAFRAPRVIILRVYNQLPRGRVRFCRQNIFARDDHTCQYCGRRLPRHLLNLDHVIPRSRGGPSSWRNIVCCCISCNLRKRDRTPAQAGMRLRREPRIPRWSPVLGMRRRALHREWLPFLNPADIAALPEQ